MLLFLTTCLLAASLRGTPPPPTPSVCGPHGPYRVGGNVKEPKEIRRVQPNYPKEARDAQLQGAIILEAIIKDDGSVDGVRVLRGIHPSLDQASVEAVKRWKYKPATMDGKAVCVYLTVVTNFSLPAPNPTPGDRTTPQ